MAFQLPLRRFRAAIHGFVRSARSSFRPHRGQATYRPRSTLFWGVLFLATLHLGLIYLFETRPNLRDPLYHERSARLQQHLAAVRDQQPALVVMLGTSRTGNAFNAGLMQEKLSAELGRPVVAFNFGIAGNGPVMQQINLRRLLEEGQKPDLVIVEVLPFFFLEHGDWPIEFDQLDMTRISSAEMEVHARYGVTRDAYQKRWNEIYLNPWSEMRFHLIRRLRPKWMPKNLLLNWNAGNDPWGWNCVDIEQMPDEVYRPMLARAYAEHGCFFPGFRFGEPAIRALVDTLELCRTAGVPALLIHLPEDSNFRAWYPPETKRLIEDTFARIASQHGAQWIDANRWLPDGHFYDGHHMLKNGAILFTERLAPECGAQLRAAR